MQISSVVNSNIYDFFFIIFFQHLLAQYCQEKLKTYIVTFQFALIFGPNKRHYRPIPLIFSTILQFLHKRCLQRKLNVYVLFQPEPPPSPGIDRTNDPVYDNTTNVVRAVMTFTKGLNSMKPELYIDHIKVCKKVQILPLHSKEYLIK